VYNAIYNSNLGTRMWVTTITNYLPEFLVICNEEKLHIVHIYVEIAKPRGDY